MKANELMVGDWVMVTSNPPEPMKIGYIDNGGWLAHLQPIPITDEILEKNGWKKKLSQLDTWRLRDFPNLRIMCKYNWWDCWGFYIDLLSARQKTRIIYCHELQHALRLCGLNELADNFKI